MKKIIALAFAFLSLAAEAGVSFNFGGHGELVSATYSIGGASTVKTSFNGSDQVATTCRRLDLAAGPGSELGTDLPWRELTWLASKARVMLAVDEVAGIWCSVPINPMAGQSLAAHDAVNPEVGSPVKIVATHTGHGYLLIVEASEVH